MMRMPTLMQGDFDLLGEWLKNYDSRLAVAVATAEGMGLAPDNAAGVFPVPDAIPHECLAARLTRLAAEHILPDNGGDVTAGEDVPRRAKPLPPPRTPRSVIASIRGSLSWGGWAGSKQIERLAMDHDDGEMEEAVQSLTAGEIATILCEVPDSLAAAFMSPAQFALAFDLVAAQWGRPDPEDFSGEQEDLSSFLVSAINGDATPERFRSMVEAFAAKDLAPDALVFLAIDSQSGFAVFQSGPDYPYERCSFEEITIGLREHAPGVFSAACDTVRSILEDDGDAEKPLARRKAEFASDFISDAKRKARNAQRGFLKTGRRYFAI